MSVLIKYIRSSFVVAIFGTVLTGIIICAAFSDYIAPYDPLAIDPNNFLANPSLAHPFGTDELGRDILSRVISGARISLSVSFSAVIVACLLGVPLGVLTAFVGKRFEIVVMRIIDVWVSLPEIFVAIVALAFLPKGSATLIFLIGIAYLPQLARVSNNTARAILSRDHVLAAVSLGAGPSRIMYHEVFVNMRAVVVVQASFTMSSAMLLEAFLSFLGMGVPPPQPSWGQMIGILKDYMFTNAWPIIFPSMALFLTILALNILGDELQDRLNPELSK